MAKTYKPTTESNSPDPDSDNLGTATLTWTKSVPPGKILWLFANFSFPAENTQPLQYGKFYPVAWSIGDGISITYAQGVERGWTYDGGFMAFEVNREMPKWAQQVRAFIWSRWYQTGSALLVVEE